MMPTPLKELAPFTEDDVERLRNIANARTMTDAYLGIAVGKSVAEWLTSLADRIETRLLLEG